MSTSFWKRLKWYGGIFLIASIVFGVNIFQYDKVKFRYAIEKSFMCDKQFFLQKVWKKNNYTSMADQYRSQSKPKSRFSGAIIKSDNKESLFKKPTHVEKPKQENKYLSMTRDKSKGRFSRLAEAEEAYRKCIVEREVKLQEIKSKKDRTEFMLITGTVLLILALSLALIDFIVQLYKKGTITKIGLSRFMIVVSSIWVLVAFSENYRSRGLRIDNFVFVGIVPVVVVLGLMWVFGLLRLKNKN